ncbi:MAG TPA: TIM barrel protein [Thermomicrobiales bacterium]|jgi:sugar phosphate isomerase/epimerase|nr:TIM barrel protein [Thermomicrobiales bacterium]
MRRAVSTWSLHRTLGRRVAPDSAASGGPFMETTATADAMTLLELPAELARRGYDAVQICHFHLPSRDPAYLAELRDAIESAGIELESLLIDDGDLTDPSHGDAMEAWISGWLGTGVALGATRARVVAGLASPTPETLQTAATRLRRLAEAHPDIRVVTENWKGLLPDGATMRQLLELTGDQVGLLIDLGNWARPEKYDELPKIAALAESCHAKCHTTGSELDADDYRRTLTILKDAGYDGPMSLIYDGADDDEWTMLDREWEIVRSVFA